MEYNRLDIESILDYAKALTGKSLNDIVGEKIKQHKYTGKGSFGNLLEKYYFGYEPNSNPEPDFHEVGLEVKSTPLKVLKKKKDNLPQYRAKERLVLNFINYFDIISQNFNESSFLKKNQHLLLIFYFYEAHLDIIDYIIKIVGNWDFADTDLEIIRNDWEIIKNKILAGKAHELSEGDTFYLGACTKGAKAENLIKQPNSTTLAKSRAFSFKQGYLNQIIYNLNRGKSDNYGKLITNKAQVKKATLDEIVVSKFDQYINKSTDEIEVMLGVALNKKSKNYYASLTKLILGIGTEKEVEEFEKAEIIVKTVRLKENNMPKEDISFPVFKYTDIIEEDWEDSTFLETLEHKFFFVFFQFHKGVLYLKKVKFWNMPFEDKKKAELVWSKTKEVVISGNIVKEIKGKRRLTNFPNKSFSKVAHIRPHALNSKDTNPLPVNDKFTGLDSYTKHCFWLNNVYIKDEIYLKK